MEVLPVGTVELVDTVEGVGGRVRVDDVHQHREAVAVRRVNEVLELVGGTATQGRPITFAYPLSTSNHIRVFTVDVRGGASRGS